MKSRKPFWNEHISQCNNSGMSQKEYCGEKELNYNTFKYWQYKLKKDEMNNSGFVELSLKPLNINSEIKIMLSNGITISVNPSLDANSVKQFIKTLRELS